MIDNCKFYETLINIQDTLYRLDPSNINYTATKYTEKFSTSSREIVVTNFETENIFYIITNI